MYVHVYLSAVHAKNPGGNGLRGVALFLDHQGRVPLGVRFPVEMTGSGAHDCVVIEARGRSGIVEAEMGFPRMGEGAEGSPDRLRIGVGGREVEVIFMDGR